MNISDSILWQAVMAYAMVQGFVLFPLLFRGGKDRFASRMIAFLSLFCGIILVEEFISVTIGYAEFPHAIFAAGPFWYLIAPTIYLFIRHYTHRRQLSWLDSFHLAPALYVLLTSLDFYLFEPELKIYYFQKFLNEGQIAASHNFNYLIYLIQSLSYSIGALYLIRTRLYQEELRNLGWLKSLCVGLIVLASLGLSLVISVNFGYQFIPITADLDTLWISGFILFIFHKSYHRQSQLFFKVREEIKNERLERSEAMDKIISLMTDKKPYLDPAYDIQEMSRELHMTKHHIRKEIRINTQLSFRQFVNQFRIREAQLHLKTDESQLYTIEYISQLAGFSNHATFYRLFRDSVGKTPKAYANEA